MASLGSVQASVNSLKLPKLSCHVKVAAIFSITALSINASQHNATDRYAECHRVECRHTEYRWAKFGPSFKILIDSVDLSDRTYLQIRNFLFQNFEIK